MDQGETGGTVTPFTVRKKRGRPPGKRGNGGADSPGSGAPPKLSGEDMAVILRLSAAGQSARAIARTLSAAGPRPISARTIDRWLARVRTPNETVSSALAALRMDAVSGWSTAIRSGARFGKHAPARDLLQATGVIERDAPTERLTIIVGDGTVAIGRLPPALRTLPPAPALQD